MVANRFRYLFGNYLLYKTETLIDYILRLTQRQKPGLEVILVFCEKIRLGTS